MSQLLSIKPCLICNKNLTFIKAINGRSAHCPNCDVVSTHYVDGNGTIQFMDGEFIVELSSYKNECWMLTIYDPNEKFFHKKIFFQRWKEPFPTNAEVFRKYVHRIIKLLAFQ